jgi:predicted DNA-binding antitoxin AbrB/MazE fold protein
MVIQGHIQNGVVIPHDNLSLPNGTEVTITVRAESQARAETMSDSARKRYLEALERVDAITNENPGDTFGGADHDRALYGDQT